MSSCTLPAPRATRGFTLIELLVVIAIIAVLAAILFPVFAKVREKARQISCISNEKQVALGFMQYVQDNDETYPIGDAVGSGLGAYINGRGWATRVFPYVKSAGVFRCSDDPTADTTGLNGSAGEVDSTVSYGYNSDLDALGPNGALASLSAPAATVLLFEAQNAHEWLTAAGGDSSTAVKYNSSPGGNGGDGGAGYIDLDSTTSTPVQYATGAMGQPEQYKAGYFVSEASGRHTDASNFALADGHVKYLHRQYVSPGFAAINPTDDQGIGTSNGVTVSRGAGTGAMGQAPKNFVATFSPV